MSCCLCNVHSALQANHNVTAKFFKKHNTEEAWKVVLWNDRLHVTRSSPKCLLHLSLPDLFIPLSRNSVSPAASLPWKQWREKGEDKEKLRNLKFVWNLFPWTFHTVEQITSWFHSNRKTTCYIIQRDTHPKQKQVKNNYINQNLQRGYKMETWSLSEHWLSHLNIICHQAYFMHTPSFSLRETISKWSFFRFLFSKKPRHFYSAIKKKIQLLHKNLILFF